MANLTKWFGYPIYISQLKNYQEINTEIVPLIKEEVTPTNSQYGRTTDVKPTELQSIDDNLHLDPRFEKLYKEIDKVIVAAMAVQNYDLDLFEVYITKSWATYSTKDQFIAYHRHMSSHYSFVYYPYAEEQGNLFFLDDEAHKVGLHIPRREPYFNKWDSSNYAKAEYPATTGNIIIFPSMIFHETGINTKEDARISISGDIMLTMKANIKSEHNIPSPSTWRMV